MSLPSLTVSTQWVLHLLTLLLLPPLIPGLINKVKAVMAGRSGPPVLQLYYDLAKLARKQAVFSRTTTWVFLAGPVGTVAAGLVAGLLVPFGHTGTPLSFEGDVILFAYLFGLARFLTVLSALDTGSSFEGMGAAREVAFSALAEPALFLGFAALAKASSSLSLSTMLLGSGLGSGRMAGPLILVLVGWAIVFLAENARIPVDDPNTHLELTMIHEVMILDHSGPELAVMQYAAGLKMTIYAGLIAALLNPFDVATAPLAAVPAALLIMALVAVAVGCVESLTARLRMRLVPRYLMLASLLAALCLGSAGWLVRSL